MTSKMNKQIKTDKKQENITIGEIDLSKDNNLCSKMDASGKAPSSRFGHTLTMVNSNKLVLFGGAVGDTKNFTFSNETFSLNLSNMTWSQLECSKIILNFRWWK